MTQAQFTGRFFIVVNDRSNGTDRRPYAIGFVVDALGNFSFSDYAIGYEFGIDQIKEAHELASKIAIEYPQYEIQVNEVQL